MSAELKTEAQRKEYFDMARHPRVGCGAAILSGDKLLLVQRRIPPEANYWGLPGGKIDWQEPVEHAVRREISEELGLTLNNLSLLCVTDQVAYDPDDHWVALVYLATSFEGEPTLLEPEKHAAISWFPLTDLPAHLTVATLAAIKALQTSIELRRF
nr:NUDIX domain-containing protein [Acetobacter musti]